MSLKNIFSVIVLLFGISVIGASLNGEELNRSDPEKVANFILNEILSENYEAVINLMTPEQQKDYLPLTTEKRKEVDKLFSRDKKKIGKIKQVSELRKLTTFRGKDGVAAKIDKRDEEVYVIILSLENNRYYFEDTLNLSSDLYKKLELVKKIK
jgi:hypothetical protein